MKKIKDSTMGKVRMLSKEQMKKLSGRGVDPDPIGGCYVIGTKCSVNNQQQCCSGICAFDTAQGSFTCS